MANRRLHVFGWEIISYEEAVSEAFTDLQKLVAYPSPPAGPIHSSVRRILADSALTSHVFFPSGTKPSVVSRAEFLRREFCVSDSSLLKSRALRNHISHIDERFDTWATKSTNQTFGRRMLGSRGDALRVGLRGEDILGLFDTRTFVFSFLEDDLQVDDLVGEIRAIAHLVRKRLRNLHWDQGPQ